MVISSREYDLRRPDVLQEIHDSRPRFVNCMVGSYETIARSYGMTVTVSSARLQDAYAFWCKDLSRKLQSGIEPPSSSLDHFKQSAFLTFWLRRFHPLERMDSLYHHPEDDATRHKKKWFSLYGNEICALHVGLKISQNYTLQMMAQTRARSDVCHFPFRQDDLIRTLQVAPAFEVDTVMILKDKNNSPHSINLLFRALFAGLQSRTLG